MICSAGENVSGSHSHPSSSRDNPGLLHQYPSENELGHFVDNEPVYVPRSTMVDIIYRCLGYLKAPPTLVFKLGLILSTHVHPLGLVLYIPVVQGLHTINPYIPGVPI